MEDTHKSTDTQDDDRLVVINGRSEKAGDLWATPPSLIGFAKHRFGIDEFDFDACATPSTTVGPKWYGHQADGTFIDALQGPWLTGQEDGVVWCNPPYSSGNLLAFAAHAIKQFDGGRSRVDRVVFLGKLDPSTKWFKLLAKSPRCHEVVMISPWVHFLGLDGKPVRGTNFCSVLFDLRRSTPKRKTFSLGEFTR